MLSRCAWIARPRFAGLATRSLSDAGGRDSGATAAPPVGPKTAKEDRLEKMDQLMKPFIKDDPGKVYESNRYSRRFLPTETYHPAELDEGNARRTLDFSKQERPTVDPFRVLGLDPLKEYKNALVLSNFVTEMGRIKPRHKSGLTAKSQRRVAKAIRRARSFGLLPITSKLDAPANHRSLGRGGSNM